jgi:hypothetical protein
MPEILFLDELEKQFREIAERDALATPRRVRRRRRRVLALGSALAALAVIAVVAIDPFAPSSSRLVAAARAATVPARVVEHVVTTTQQIEGDRTVTSRDEIWTASGEPLGYREIVDNPVYGGIIERADAPGVSSTFDAASGVIYERTLPPDFINLDPTRPSEDLVMVRRALTYSGARDKGPVIYEGRTLQRFDFGSRESNGQRCSYYATREEYVPVAVDCVNLVGSPWVRAHIAYEFLERSEANDALLSIRAQHPGAAVDRAPITDCDREPHYYGTGVGPDFAGDPRNAPCAMHEAG